MALFFIFFLLTTSAASAVHAGTPKLHGRVYVRIPGGKTKSPSSAQGRGRKPKAEAPFVQFIFSEIKGGKENKSAGVGVGRGARERYKRAQ